MAKHVQLVEHKGGYSARFYADGRRVSRDRFEAIKDGADRLECMTTKARALPGGRFRRTNYAVAVTN